MKRVTVSFYDEIFQKIEARMQSENSPSVAQCVRELVDLGMRVEESVNSHHEKKEENDLLLEITNLKKLLKNSFIWSLETRLLTRFLVDNHPAEKGENKADILDKYKDSAINYVNGLYGEKIE